MSTPVTPDTPLINPATPPDGIFPDASETSSVATDLSVDDPILAGLLGEQCLTEEASSMLPEAPQDWVAVPVNYAEARLNWNPIYARLETVAEGAVVMVPTAQSGWVKIVKGSSPTGSAFYIQGDTLYVEPGSVADIYRNAPPPEDPLDRVHYVLDVLGLAPVLGTPADLANTVLYFIQGDSFSGTLSMMAMIPLIGEGTTLAKWGVRYGDDLVNFGRRELLRERMNVLEGLEAHHIIPWELRYHDIVQAAGRSGFDINDLLNGAALEKMKITRIPIEMEVTRVGTAIKENVKLNLTFLNGMHANHPAYNFYAIKLLESHAKEVMTIVDGIEEIDPLLASELLKNIIIPKMTSLIDDCISQKLPINGFFKIKLYDMKWLDTYKDYASSARFYSMIHGTDELLDGINVLK